MIVSANISLRKQEKGKRKRTHRVRPYESVYGTAKLCSILLPGQDHLVKVLYLHYNMASYQEQVFMV